MKDFLKQFSLFLLIPLLLIVALLYMPVTPRAKTSLLFAEIKKDSLLQAAKSPRLVMIGGSNLSMSLDSQQIKDSVKLSPVNLGLHAAIGLVFMLDHTEPYIKKGDVVLVVPEYAQLYGNFAYGEKELLSVIFDVKSAGIDDLNWRQIKNIVPFVPKFAFAKLNKEEYKVSDTYLRMDKAFNGYGDWVYRLDSVTNNTTYQALEGSFNDNIIDKMKDFETEIVKKGAKMVVSFPAYEEESYKNSAAMIQTIEKAYKDAGFTVIGNPEKYKFSNSLMYDTPYHLNAEGVKIRTRMLIHDLLYEAHLKSKP